MKIAFYGTLMRGQAAHGIIPEGKLAWIGPCSIPGDLYDLGEFPGLVPGEGSAAGELYEVRDPSLIPELDRYEGFDPGRPGDSLFARREAALRAPRAPAWVYYYNHPVAGRMPIAGGDWAKYLAARGAVPPP